jgi:hypothetical protein
MLQPAQAELRPDQIKRVVAAFANRRPASWLCALAAASMAVATDLATAQTASTNTSTEFNIPSQPLAVALTQYGDATQREVLYDTRYAAGKISGEVKGFMDANEALQKLLVGTNLSSRVLSESAFVLVPKSQQPPAAPRALSPDHRRYYALIQRALLDTLCRSTAAFPGSYRILVMFWINRASGIERLERIGSAGDAVDEEIGAALRSARLPEAPPADFAQPVLIELVPQGAGVTAGCSATRATRNSSGVPK